MTIPETYEPTVVPLALSAKEDVSVLTSALASLTLALLTLE
jgi:hypothetical protein